MSRRAERRRFERYLRSLPHHVRLGGPVIGPPDHRELVQDVWIAPPQPKGTDLRRVQWRKLNAIVDTGCTRTAIRMDIAAELGLPVIGSKTVGTASSGMEGEGVERPTVLGLLLIFETTKREAVAERELITQDMRDEMLLGLDLLDGGIFTVDLVHLYWEWKMIQRRAAKPDPIL